MKPVPFDYIRPDSIETVLELLATREDARIIAGGQSLIPMLAMRLARPELLIDIGRIKSLSGIRAENNQLIIGATTRHVEVETNLDVRQSCPLLSTAIRWVGHAPIRERGTLGGSVAHADPSAEVPLVLVALNAELVLANRSGTRTVPVRDFLVGPMMTTAVDDECLIEIRIPVWQHPKVGVGFHEVANRRSDFAIVSAAVKVAVDDTGKWIACAVGLGGVEETPVSLASHFEQLIGSRPDENLIHEAARNAVKDLPAMHDPSASASYRKRAAVKLLQDAFDDAVANANRTEQ